MVCFERELGAIQHDVGLILRAGSRWGGRSVRAADGDFLRSCGFTPRADIGFLRARARHTLCRLRGSLPGGAAIRQTFCEPTAEDHRLESEYSEDDRARFWGWIHLINADLLLGLALAAPIFLSKNRFEKRPSRFGDVVLA